MVAPTLTDYSFQYTDTGVALNPDSSSTPFVDVLKVTGLDNAPVRSSTKDSEGQDGGVVEADYETIRTLTVEGTFLGVTETYLDALKENFAVRTTAQPFYVKAPGVVQRVVFCKSLGLQYDWTTARRISIVDFMATLQAPDPIIYSSDVETGTVGVSPPITTGRSYNRLYPLSYGGAITSGVFTLTNLGNRPVGATFVITGPVNNPIVVSDTEGKQIQVLISLGVSDTLTIDLSNRSILLNDVTNRRNLMTTDSKWFKLQVGSNSLRYNATSVTASQLTYTFRHGWR